MAVVSQGALKSMKLPTGWKTGEEVYGQIGLNWKRCFQPDGADNVTITVFYRGRPLEPEPSTRFREALNGEQKVLYAEGNGEPLTQERNLLAGLYEALGNTGDNQIVNHESGFRGPCFHIQKLEQECLNGRNVLAVEGWFRDEEDNLVNAYRGIFFDASPEDTLCKIEEVFLQARDRSLFSEYLPSFHQTIKTITWS